ncbi:hypothetical protein WJX72_003878 [[Myrmecia] bisecta]|uniref:RRM domain-containing protein n=1 Tax=[Myrmecia] bisecta TaxID=41462 RepID=A0AAW1R5N2_9CHLO
MKVESAVKRAPLAERKKRKLDMGGEAAADDGGQALSPEAMARQKLVRTVAVGNLTVDTAQEALQRARAAGKVEEVLQPAPEEEVDRAKLRLDGCRGSIIFVVYDSVKGAMDAVVQLHGKPISPRAEPQGQRKRRKTVAGVDPQPAQADGHDEVKLWARQVSGEGLHLKKWRLILRNLPFQVKEEDVRQLLSPAGFVWELTLPCNADGKTRGFAFAGFTCRAHAEKAILLANGKELSKRTIAVDWAVPKAQFAKVAEGQVVAGPPAVAGLDEREQAADSDDEPDEDADHDAGSGSDDVGDSAEDASASEDEAPEAEVVERQVLQSALQSVLQQHAKEGADEEASQAQQPKPNVVGPQAGAAAVQNVGRGGVAGTSRDDPAPAESRTVPAESRTVFVRGLPLDMTSQQLQARLESFGRVKACRLVVDKVTKKQKGTAFVEFREAASAKKAADACARARKGEGPGIVVAGRPLEVDLALSQDDARSLAAQKLPHFDSKDNRNLYLAKEGVIEEGSAAYEAMSASDRTKRAVAHVEAKTKLRSPNFCVSTTRLCIRNIPPAMDDKALRKLCIQAVKDHAAKAKPQVKQVKILVDENKVGPDGRPKSRGMGFIEFSEHEHALCALRELNNNPTAFSRDRRPIVEFAIENARVLRKRHQRLQMQKEKPAGDLQPERAKAHRQARNGSAAEVAGPAEPAEATAPQQASAVQATDGGTTRRQHLKQKQAEKQRRRKEKRLQERQRKQVVPATSKPQQTVQPSKAAALGKQSRAVMPGAAARPAPAPGARHRPAPAPVGKRKRQGGAGEAAPSRRQKQKDESKTGKAEASLDQLVANYKTKYFAPKQSAGASTRGPDLKRWFD